MKIIIKYILVVIIFLNLLSQQTQAQLKSDLSLGYNHSVKFISGGKVTYPLGFNASYNFPISNRFFLNTGFEYSFRKNTDNLIWSDATLNSVERTETMLKESIYTIKVGAKYPLVFNRLFVNLGANILPSYLHGELEIDNFYESSLISTFSYFDSFSLGINPEIRIAYLLSEKLSVFIEPGYIYYFLGDLKTQSILHNSIGINFYLGSAHETDVSTKTKQ
jgi:hypothetical protein